MEAVQEFSVTRVAESRLPQVDFNKLGFGAQFTDHMLEADYIDGEWVNVSIKPYQPLSFDPALAAIHYGQSIFEGIKAFKTPTGEAVIFRPQENFKRFNKSAARMSMPQVPEEIFLGGMLQLIALDKDWIPQQKDCSLYIRPFMFATDVVLGVRPSASYKFIIILSPSGAYFARPMKILVEEKYTRAAPGGVGFAKNAGNYGGSLVAAAEANKGGFDQVLWTDAFEHKWLQEVGMMNVFFIIDGIAVTPSLEEGTILDGVTRKSVMQVLENMGVKVEERPLHIDEVTKAYAEGKVTEVFGTGTAAVISPIQLLHYRGTDMPFEVDKYKISPAVKDTLTGIQQGKLEDNWGWLTRIED